MRRFPSVLIHPKYRVHCQTEAVVELVCDRVIDVAIRYDDAYLYVMDCESGDKRFIVVPHEHSIYMHKSMMRREKDGEVQLIGVYKPDIKANHIRSDVFFEMGW